MADPTHHEEIMLGLGERPFGLGALLLLVSCGRSDMTLVPSSDSSSSASDGDSTRGDSGTTATAGSTSGPTSTGIDTSTTEDSLDSGTTDPPPIECGNGIIEPGEPCDDGNDDELDACLPTCELATCGDGLVWSGVEECDDADLDDDDGCHLDCTLTQLVAVAAGGNHNCVLVDDGDVRCWGNGNNGRTGYGTTENFGDDEPAGAAGVVSLGGPVAQVIAGIGHSCVRYPEGTVRCFGRSAEGQLGYGVPGDIGDDELPLATAFVPLGGPVDLLSTGSGSFHGCARLTSGDVRCWGDSGAGRLGVPGLLGPVGDDETPDAIPPVNVGGTVLGLSTGAQHSCALLDGGAVRCWGSNASGQLGRGLPGDVGDDEDPADVAAVAVGAVATQIVAGWFHSCALLDGGAVRCWGRGNNGRLGYGNTTWIGLTDTPAEHGVVDVGGVVVELAAGNAHTCARLDSGAVRCWGWSAQGQLGYGNLQDIGDDELPATAGDVPLGGAALQIVAGANHSCALLDTGRLRCWGNGGDGRLGYGDLNTIGDDETPAAVGDVPLVPP
ncbi:MAG: hypothetical protein AB1Z98_29220 [Nannocystaceae bacterium]